MNKRFNYILCIVGIIILLVCWSLSFQPLFEPPVSNVAQEEANVEQAAQYAVPSSGEVPVENGSSKISLVPMPGLKEDRKLAYAFYATEHDYGCSVLVNMYILRHRLKTKVSIIWLVTDRIPELYVTVAREQFGAEVRTVSTLNPPPGTSDKYKEVMTKLQVLKLFEFDRLIVLDSDLLVQKNLDHLFYLPSVDIAIPRANWLSDTFLTSAMFVVEPSERLWRRVEKRLSNLGVGEYDMDLINSEFLGEVLVLPGNYLVLDTYFDNSGLEVPKWSHYQGHPDRFKLMWENEVMVLHFSSLFQKAWWTPIEQARNARPCATPYFLNSIDDWWTIANNTCPDWKTMEHPILHFEPPGNVTCGH